MFLNRWAIKLIKIYQSNKNKPKRCKHYPTCSNYGLECYQKFNFIKASFLTGYRILRCNPLSIKAYDPVPLTKNEKKQKKQLDNIVSNIDNSLIEIYNNSNSLNALIIYIWNVSLKDKVISNENTLMFYARLDRLLYLIKKKQINIKYRKALKYINKYMLSDIYKDPIIFINENKSTYSFE